MATRPNAFEGLNNDQLEGPAGPKSSLHKYAAGTEIKFSPDKMWMKTLALETAKVLPLLSPEEMGQPVELIKSIAPEHQGEAIGSFMREIRGDGKPLKETMTPEMQRDILLKAMASVSQEYGLSN